MINNFKPLKLKVQKKKPKLQINIANFASLEKQNTSKLRKRNLFSVRLPNISEEFIIGQAKTVPFRGRRSYPAEGLGTECRTCITPEE
jgi:hypothetical protein